MRGKKAPIRTPRPDARYGNIIVAKLVATIMKDGKKSKAERVVYGAFDRIKAKGNADPVALFEEALKNVAPIVEVRSKRVGGANLQVPFPVRAERRQALAFRWIIEAARGKKGTPMNEALAIELMEAAKKEGSAMRKRMDVHRMAEANRAFAHFAKVR